MVQFHFTMSQDKFPEQYGKFKRVKSNQGENIEMTCMFPAISKKILLDKIQSDLFEDLNYELGENFEKAGIEQLVKQIVAEWLMVCPLNFGGE